MDAYAALATSDLATQSPTAHQRRQAFLVFIALLAVFAALLPFVNRPCPVAFGFIPAHGAALAVTDLFTALLLLGQLPARRSQSIAWLAFGYLFTSFSSLVYVYYFPWLFPVGPQRFDPQLSAWIYLCSHLAFPAFILRYIYAGQSTASPAFVRLGLGLTTLLVLGFVTVGSIALPHLPVLVSGLEFTPAYHFAIWAAIGIGFVTWVALGKKQPWKLLDMWLMVALLACMLDVVLSAGLSTQRFNLGFYAGRVYGLLASLMVLAVLTAENLSLHERLSIAAIKMIEVKAGERSHALLLSVLQQLPEGVIILEMDDNVVMANDRAAEFAGVVQDAGVMSTENAAKVRAMVRTQVARVFKGEFVKDELAEISLEGRRRVLTISGVPVNKPEGGVATAVLTLHDFTERFEAETRVLIDLSQTKALLESSPLAAIEWGEGKVIRRWTGRAEELFGWKSDEVVGGRLDELCLIHPADQIRVNEVFDDLLTGRRAYVRFENRNITRDGRMLVCEWYNSTIYDSNGRLDAVYSLALDVTEQRHAMEQLRDADRQKDVFIATLAHELRNPLAPISNAASLLLSQAIPQERVTWLATMINRQSSRMSRLLDDLLDVSRISRGKVELRREETELGNLVRESLQTSMPLIEAGHHHLQVCLPATPVWAQIDPLRITQVITNLVNNAAKYTPRAGRIEVTLGTEGDIARLTIKDNGIGIGPEMLARVFDPFVQDGRASDMSQGGVGIGLALARGLVQLHGGSITAQSDGPACGSLFTVTLPTCTHTSSDSASGSDEHTSAVFASILIADDNEDAADSLAQLLRIRGATVEVAHDGEEALQRFLECPADIAILDLGMPRLGGLELARRLSKVSPRPYLIAITGRGRSEDRNDSLAAGFDEHLTKPVPLNTLIELLQTASKTGCARHREHHGLREPADQQKI